MKNIFFACLIILTVGACRYQGDSSHKQLAKDSTSVLYKKDAVKVETTDTVVIKKIDSVTTVD
ncbi:MAG: hypothetical protein AAF843_04620 [Bacteroidota bacterium]